MSFQVVVAVLALAGAAPEQLTVPGFRLHLQLSENIDPDRLEALARPGVVLWLETASNLLKRSVAERVGRAEGAYVQVRPPPSAVLRQQFTGRVHPWVALEGLDVAAYRRWAPAGTAVEWVGALTEERLSSLRALRPQVVRWQPESPPAPEEWARAARLSGLEISPKAPLPPCEHPLKGAVRARLRVPPADAESSATGCGFALRLEVPVGISEVEVRDLLVQFPGAELSARVFTEAEALAAARLVALLTAAAPSPHRTTDAGVRGRRSVQLRRRSLDTWAGGPVICRAFRGPLAQR
jgi:hypothetical protein